MDTGITSLEGGVAPRRQATFTETLAALDEFRLSHPKEIVWMLRQLAIEKDFLKVTFGRHGQSIISYVLHVDEGNGVFLFDYGAGDIDNRILLASSEILFSGMLEGIHVRFLCGKPEPHFYDGFSAFKVALPKSLYRIQRRQHFRVEMPIANPFICSATLPDQRRIDFNIVDLSLTGVRLRPTDTLTGELAIGATLTDAVLDFRDLGMVESDLNIVHVQRNQHFSDQIWHIGCRFTALLKAKEPEVQRLITYMELRRKGR